MEPFPHVVGRRLMYTRRVLTAVLGSDGTIHYWDKDARTRLKCAYHDQSTA